MVMKKLRPWWTEDPKRLTLVGIFYLVGILGHLMPLTRPLMLTLTPGFLALFGILAALPSLKEGGWKFLWWLLPAYLFTFGLEALGVATGLIFGAYNYGPVLGPMVLQVPVVIGFNWVLVVLGAIQWGRRIPLGRFTGKTWVTAVFAAVVCVFFDWIMEPLAIGLNYWTWESGVIPLQNYLSWGLIAAVTAIFHSRVAPRETGIFAGGYLVIQTIFFLALRIGGLGA